MPTQYPTVGGGRRGLIAGLSALALLAFVIAFDNQWTAAWRARTSAPTAPAASTPLGGVASVVPESHSWLALPVGHLSDLSWRASPLSGERARDFAASLAAPTLAVLLTLLLVLLVCRGVAATRGRWTLFFGVWAATAAASGLGLLAGVLVAGGSAAPLSKGTTYYTPLQEGAQFAFYLGWLIGLIAVLVYSFTGGAEELADTAEYDLPSGYDYGSATPANYYGQPYGTGPTQSMPVQSPENPYGGRSY